MKTYLSTLSSASGCVLLLFCASRALSCGTNTAQSATITSLPGSDDPSFQVNALSARGEIAGQFAGPSQGQIHAFYYFNGSIADLGTLGGTSSTALALSPSGLVAGQAGLAGDSQTHAFRWGGGPPLDLGTLGGSSSTPAAINDAGQVAGGSRVAGNASTMAFLFSEGSMSSLGTLGGNYSTAYDLNSAGLVVGESSVNNGDIHGFVYSSGTMTEVGTLGGDYSSCFAVNAAGAVVGEFTTADGDIHGFLYSQGVMHDVGTLDGTFCTAFGVNASGQVIGIGSAVSDTEWHGFLYSEGKISDLGTLGGFFSFTEAINNLGQVVGDSAIPDGTSHAVLWQQGSMVDLNTLLPANSGWELGSARFINDSGRIVGLGTLNGVSQWFVMDLVSSDAAPVALPGPDQAADCQGEVTLDGSHSYAPDGSALTYQWSAGGQVIGTNATLTGYFATGTNIITLKVTNPCGGSAQTNVVVSVVDTTPPLIGSSPAKLTLTTDANGQAVVPDMLPTIVASDNCTPTTLLKMSQSPGAGSVVGLGDYNLTVTVTDASGNSTSKVIILAVVDQIPPSIQSLVATPNQLWPPNHRLVPVTLNVTASDNCDAAPRSRIVSITCNQPTSAWETQIAGDLNASLAASWDGTPRVYSITIECIDASGNKSTATASVTVSNPREQGSATANGDNHDSAKSKRG
jgi:probable HAF family extracellular repeat protein